VNARKLLLPLVVLVVAVTAMFAYYDLYRRTAVRIATLDTALSTVDGLAEAGIRLPRIDGHPPTVDTTPDVRVLVAADLLMVDGVRALVAKMERTGTAIKPRDSRNFVARTEGAGWTRDALVSQIAWQFTNIDTLRLVGTDEPPLRRVTLVVAADVASTRFAEALTAAREAGAVEVRVAFESDGKVAYVVWPATSDVDETADLASAISRAL
jgi:hypothetical protein